MKTASLTKNVIHSENKMTVNVLLETECTKEVRITIRKGEVVREHFVSLPMVIELFEGRVDFGIQGNLYAMEKGDLLTLGANIPHDLRANADSIIRMTLLKFEHKKKILSVSEYAEKFKKIAENN